MGLPMTRLRREVSKAQRIVELFKDGDTWIVTVWAPNREGGKDVAQTATNRYEWADDTFCKALDDRLLAPTGPQVVRPEDCI